MNIGRMAEEADVAYIDSGKLLGTHRETVDLAPFLARFADLVLEEAAKEADIWQEITDRRGRSNKDGVYIAAAIRGMKSNPVRVHDEPHVP